MITLSTLQNTDRPKKKIQRVGRGVGSKRGKTSGRGHKGDKARSGYKTRLGKEGGQLPLFRKMPTRGFHHGRFRREAVGVNLGMIEETFKAGEVVNYESLRARGLVPRNIPGGIKILGQGELKKKVTIEAHRFSKTAREKLEKSGSSIKELPLGSVSK